MLDRVFPRVDHAGEENLISTVAQSGDSTEKGFHCEGA